MRLRKSRTRFFAANCAWTGLGRSHSLLLFFWLTFPLALPSQTPNTPLSLDDCLALARQAPSQVKRAQANLVATVFGVRAAQANFLPQLTLSSNFIYNNPLLFNHDQFSFVALNGVHEYSSVANTALEIDTSGRLRALYEKAQAQHGIAQATVAISERDLAQAVSVAFYRVLLTRRLALSAQDNEKVATGFQNKVQELVDGGEASRADLAKAQQDAAMLATTATSLTTQAELAQHDLAAFWTADTAQPLTLAGDLDSVDAATAAAPPASSYLNRPEFSVYRFQIQSLDADARVARARMLPQLNMNFEYGLDSTHVAVRDRGYAGFVHLDIPVFDFFRARDEKRQFQEQATAARVDADVAKRTFSREYQDALSAVNGARDALGSTATQRDAARENLRLSRLRFDGGEGSALDVVTAQNDLVQAEINFYSTRANYLNAQAALKVASGQ